MISGSFELKPTNSTAWDLFGQLEFSIESHTLSNSGATIRYGITTAEISFSITDGTSDRNSWFCDQLLGQTMEATVTDAHDTELENVRTSGSKVDASEKGFGLEDSSSRSKRTKSGTKSEVQYKTHLINVRAVGRSDAPMWHFVPQQGSQYLAGYLPAAGTRIMQVLPFAASTPIEIGVSSYIEYSLISLSGEKTKANAAIIARAVWHKHFRSKKRSKKLTKIISPRS